MLISIHLMLILNLLYNLVNRNWQNFNTSNVDIKLCYNLYERSILCYFNTSNVDIKPILTLSTIDKMKYFNTSNVDIKPIRQITIFSPSLYFNTSNVDIKRILMNVSNYKTP